MKKNVLLALVLVLFSISMLGKQLVIKVSGSTTHHVYPGQSIQAAINSAQPDDTIFVHAGTYYENVIVNKTVSLIGENKHTTIIDGGAAQFDVVYVSAHNVTINSFALQRGGRGIHPDRRGIYVYSSNNINISNNVIRDNVEGIFICISNDNVIRNNSVHANTKNGLWLYGSSNNVITYNTIANNGEFGMVLQGTCSNNLIFHNNFINDENHHIATTGESGNVWDDGYPSGGNYWSDYKGTDFYSGPYQNETASDGFPLLLRDGIGDTLYIIDENNQDNYPLMGMFSDFKATPEHHVQTICNFAITDFHFNGTAISFNAISQIGTMGFCRICIPKALMNVSTVIVESTQGRFYPIFTWLPCSNSTHSYLYFGLNLSDQEVILVPEFPAWGSMLLILIILSVAIAIYKRRLLKTPTQ